MNIYELNNLTVQINNFSLSAENCRLEKGKVYALTGPNGCGKTAFLNLLFFLNPPLNGQIYFEGKKINYRDPEQLLAARRKICYLMQNPYLFNTSVYENVGYGLRMRQFPKEEIHSRIMQILHRLSLTHLRERNARRISGGEAQRVALARTLILDGNVFLLDEPTANVDRDNIHMVEELILSMNKKRDVTVVFTTHSLAQAYRISQNVISVVNGQIKNIAYENVFSGILQKNNGLKSVSLNNGLKINIASGEEGPVNIVIEPQNIILSSKKINSSALNNFYGTITKIEEVNGCLRVFVDVGVTFCALVTYASFYDMGLNIGRNVWLTFKANSVHTL
jgi:tungstate transport system ATP-binding protein